MAMGGGELEQALESIFSFVPTLVLKSAILLNIPDIIAKAGPNASLTLDEIALELPTETPNLHYLSRILTYLSTKSIFVQTQTSDNSSDIRYGLTATTKLFFVRENNPRSLVPLLLMHTHPVLMTSWHHLHECVLQDTNGFEKAHGKDLWAYGKDDPLVNNVVNDCMSTVTDLGMEQIVSCYDGFKDVKTLVDVGGGKGTALAHIVKVYRHIHGINYDLPHVVQTAPSIAGIENVGGSMFDSIPSADAIFVKNVFIDWDEEKCEQILGNCHKALPENGKLIVAENITMEGSMSNKSNDKVVDLVMIVLANGGKERSEKEWKRLLQKSGFSVVKMVEPPGPFSKLKIIEAIKV
ncbi:desmethylxanthohumol 6'-O-methyltransferase-like [Cryptomeria japonica]|uniref:desmethylxanthohumol 6'-O-methyltransferase-like n=1 Tax=Cryptomeria japonica TaxID=3369 RepID=UPI0027D9EFD5|nr:desmethylxanthohumol 6'-O-methyltransferase-like [Cryptomeria japonica]